jgi:hypothetical protein
MQVIQSKVLIGAPRLILGGNRKQFFLIFAENFLFPRKVFARCKMLADVGMTDSILKYVR